MNKKIFTLLTILIASFAFSISMQAQKVLEVVSMTRNDNDLRARVTERVLDDDGNTCALIIVETTVAQGLEFDPDGAGLVKRIDKTGEVWLYVPNGMRQLWIRHADYIPCQYTCTQNIEGGVVYRMRLRAGEPGADSKNQSLTINVKTLEANPKLYLDDQEEAMKDGVTTVNLPKGQHTYRIVPANTDDYEIVMGSVDLRDAPETRIIELKPKFGLLNITTLPEEGFGVYIDNEYIGNSPIKNHHLFPDNYKVTMKKTDFFDMTADVAVFPGKTCDKTYTLKSTLTNKYPFCLTAEYTYTPNSYHGIRIAMGGRWGIYGTYRWGKYFKAGTPIDDYDQYVDVTNAQKIGTVRTSYTGGIRFGLTKTKSNNESGHNAIYLYLGGGYGEYGRQWKNTEEINKNIYFYSDYVKGFEGEIGASVIWLNWLSFSAGYSAIFGKNKTSGEVQLSAGLAFNFSKIFKHKK